MHVANLDPKYLKLLINRETSTGKVSGFTLTANETYAECYCVSFPTAQMKGKGNITFSDGQIHFEHGGIGLDEAEKQLDIYGTSDGGLLSLPIKPDDATALNSLLDRSGDYVNSQVRVRYELAWGKGFTIYTNPA
jgi:hypothetical protein